VGRVRQKKRKLRAPTPAIRKGRSTTPLPQPGNAKSERIGRIGLACGVDIVELKAFRHGLKLSEDRFLERIYTPAERLYCRGRDRSLAARFAAKEAIAKALGTGVRGIAWKEMEVIMRPNGQPCVALHGRAQQLAKSLGLTRWAVSLSHTEGLAIAYVVAVADGRRRGHPGGEHSV
jgi:holo-[acyl-carrier protein] synthase